MKSIAVVGTGSLGGAILKSFYNSNKFGLDFELACYNRNIEKAKILANELVGIKVYDSLEDIAKNSDFIILTITKENLESVVLELDKYALNKDCLIISAEARTELSNIKSCMKNLKNAARIMTNTNVETSSSPLVIAFDSENSGIDIKIKNQCLEMFKAIAPVIEIEENLMDTYTILTGCLPIYMYVAMEALQDACVNSGIPIKDATYAMIETWLGTLKRLQNDPENLIKIKQELYYPGGITIHGACALEEVGFRGDLISVYNSMLKMLKESK